MRFVLTPSPPSSLLRLLMRRHFDFIANSNFKNIHTYTANMQCSIHVHRAYRCMCIYKTLLVLWRNSYCSWPRKSFEFTIKWSTCEVNVLHLHLFAIHQVNKVVLVWLCVHREQTECKTVHSTFDAQTFIFFNCNLRYAKCATRRRIEFEHKHIVIVFFTRLHRIS